MLRRQTPRSLLPTVLVLALSAACALPGRRPKRVEATPQEAQAATDARNWSLAAERWYGIFAADPGARAEACAKAAQAMLEMKDFQGASHVLDIGLRNHPEHAQLLELKGQALARLGFARAAADCFERILDREPGRASVWIQLGDVRMQLGLEGAAATGYGHAIDLGEGEASVWTRLARARRRSGDAGGALAAYARGFELAPGEVEDLLEAAQLAADPAVKEKRSVYLALGLEWLGRIVERQPNHAVAHFELGVLSEELGRKQDAVEHYLRAIELDTGCLIALRNLAVLYASIGDVEGTRKMVERALSIEQDPDRRKALQDLLEKAGRKAEGDPPPSADAKPQH